MARFKVGDRARLVAHSEHSNRATKIGTVMVIDQIGCYSLGTDGVLRERDYAVHREEGGRWCEFGVMEWQLEPITGQPTELGSWEEIERTVGWKPGVTA